MKKAQVLSASQHTGDLRTEDGCRRGYCASALSVLSDSFGARSPSLKGRSRSVAVGHYATLGSIEFWPQSRRSTCIEQPNPVGNAQQTLATRRPLFPAGLEAFARRLNLGAGGSPHAISILDYD
jgi:hypothetical protein